MKKRRNEVPSFIKGRVQALILFPIILCLIPFNFVLMNAVHRLLAPADTLFMVQGNWSTLAGAFLFFPLLVALLLFVVSLLPFKEESKFFDIRVRVLRRLPSAVAGLLIVILILVYVATTSVTYVTPTAIIDCSAFRPGGTHYTYEDVTAISTGYDYYNRRTDLYYVISLKGGPDVNVVHPLIVDEEHYGEYEKYEEIIEFDAALMERDLPKFVDPGDYKYDNLNARSRYSFYTIFNNT